MMTAEEFTRRFEDAEAGHHIVYHTGHHILDHDGDRRGAAAVAWMMAELNLVHLIQQRAKQTLFDYVAIKR